MRFKWWAYWTILIGSLFGVTYWKNSRKHIDKTRRFVLIKSLSEWLIVFVSAALLPAFLVVYGTAWLTRNVKKKGFQIAAGFAVGTILTLILGWALELIALLGVFAIDLLSDSFLKHLEERKIKRGVAIVLDGNAKASTL